MSRRPDLASPTADLPGIGPAIAARLEEELGIRTVGDLLSHLPHRYRRIERVPVGELVDGMTAVIEADVVSIHAPGGRRTGRAHVSSARVADSTGAIRAVWFNRPWLRGELRPGRRARMLGKMGERGFIVEEHRFTDDAEPDAPKAGLGGGVPPSIHMEGVVPVHPGSAGLAPKKLRGLIWQALGAVPRVNGPTPSRRRFELGLPSLSDALRAMHFPSGHLPPEESEGLDPGPLVERARKALALDELTRWQLGVRGEPGDPSRPAPVIRFRPDARRGWEEALPFTLTGSQSRCIDEILGEISGTHPMRRVLIGDVGSGKTVVAAAAIQATLDSGLQAALLAPTELLATQHRESLGRVPGLADRVHLLTGSATGAERENVLEELASARPALVIATHALLEDQVELPRLGLAIVDEQHRFGVAQREALVRKSSGEPGGIHYLQLSATPIPRTLAALKHGGLAVSEMRGSPPGRSGVETRLIDSAESSEVDEAINRCLERGGQAFVVCPAVHPADEPAAGSALPAAEVEADAVARRFPDARVELAHGGIPSARRQAAMARFASGAAEILVATTVIEVGIDVPGASVILVRAADRFGLAQLHQLRGRVGRGSEPGTCLLEAGTAGTRAIERLRALQSAADGFELAEVDLRTRGAGEALGLRQHGDLGFRFARFPDDEELLSQAEEIAGQLLGEGSFNDARPWAAAI